MPKKKTTKRKSIYFGKEGSPARVIVEELEKKGVDISQAVREALVYRYKIENSKQLKKKIIFEKIKANQKKMGELAKEREKLYKAYEHYGGSIKELY